MGRLLARDHGLTPVALERETDSLSGWWQGTTGKGPRVGACGLRSEVSCGVAAVMTALI
jgi:hypothetical protein